jgi:hypothetical protein
LEPVRRVAIATGAADTVLLPRIFCPVVEAGVVGFGCLVFIFEPRSLGMVDNNLLLLSCGRKTP